MLIAEFPLDMSVEELQDIVEGPEVATGPVEETYVAENKSYVVFTMESPEGTFYVLTINRSAEIAISRYQELRLT